jgi:hypothetical protein
MTRHVALLRVLLPWCALACSDPLDLGNDLLWSAEHEAGTLDEWTAGDSGGTFAPSADSTIEISTEHARSGGRALKLSNPTGWNPNERDPDDFSKVVEDGDEGPALHHALGPLTDAYYSAWFLLPEDYRVDPTLTLMRLGSRAAPGEQPLGGEEILLRSVKTGGYVLQVLSNNPGFLLEPLADPTPHIEPGRWFQLELRYEPQSAGRLRVWLDGALTYDLPGRPGAAAAQDIVLSVCNVAERAEPSPLVLFVDDAAVSLSRVSPLGRFRRD